MTRENKREQDADKALTETQRQLVADHFGLAQRLGRHYAALGRTKGIACEDLQQEAAWGLCVAATRYNPQEDGSFQTYAYDWCRKYIMLAIESVDEETLCDEEMTDEVDDEVYDEDEVAQSEQRWHQLVRERLSLLTGRERRVICLYYGIGHTKAYDFDEIARMLQVSVRLTRGIYNVAMDKMAMDNGL